MVGGPTGNCRVMPSGLGAILFSFGFVFDPGNAFIPARLPCGIAGPPAAMAASRACMPAMVVMPARPAILVNFAGSKGRPWEADEAEPARGLKNGGIKGNMPGAIVGRGRIAVFFVDTGTVLVLVSRLDPFDAMVHLSRYTPSGFDQS